jgi:hypothetical protein
MLGTRNVQEGTWYQQTQCAGFQSKFYNILALNDFQGVKNQSKDKKISWFCMFACHSPNLTSVRRYKFLAQWPFGNSEPGIPDHFRPTTAFSILPVNRSRSGSSGGNL